MQESLKKTPLLLTLSFKRCACCGEVKPTTEFSKKKHRDRWGFYAYCDNCKSLKAKEYSKSSSGKLSIRNRELRKYGITFEDQQRMYVEQGGKCAICGREIFLFGSSKKDTAHVDHDHLTGRVRGLLCQECNTGLGKFRDSIPYLESAIQYLKHN